MNKPEKIDKPLWHVSYAVIYAHIFVSVYGAHVFLKQKAYILPELIFWIETILAAILLMLMIVSMFRKKASTLWWEVMLMIIAFAGVWIYFLSFLPISAAILLSSIVTVSAFVWRAVYSMNLFYVFGCAGIGLLVVWHFLPSSIIFLALGVLVYDYYRSREMKMAILYHDARRSGLIPGFLLPVDIAGWMNSRIEVWNPGLGKIVSILPLMAAAAISFQLLIGYGETVFLFFCIFVMLFGFAYGLAKDYGLRGNIFLGTAISVYVIIFLVDKL